MRSIAVQKLSFKWLFKAPDWVRNDSGAKQNLKRPRLFILLFNIGIGIVAWFVVTMITITNPSPAWSQSPEMKSAAPDIVWHETSEEKAERIIIFESNVDGNIISSARFPVSKSARSDIKPGKKQKTFEYSFTLHKQNDRNFRGVTSGNIEGSVWMAGLGPNGIIFGISWVTGNKIIILNTLHIATLDNVETSEIAPGVFFKTYWTTKK